MYPSKQEVYQYLSSLANLAAEQWLQAADVDDTETAAWLEEVMDFFAAQQRAIARMSPAPFREWCKWWVREIEPHMPAVV